MKKTYQIFPIMALSTLLAACSGGGDNGGSHAQQPVNQQTKPAATKVEKKPTTSTQKQPEVIVPTEQPKQPEVIAPTEQPKQPEVVVPAEQPKQPEVVAPVEQPKQPEIVVPAEQPKQPEIVVPDEQPKQPAVVAPVEQPKQPEVVVPAEQPKQPEIQPEQPKIEPKAEKPEQPAPQPEKDTWSNAASFPHAANEVPVIYLIENDKAKYADDPNIKAKENSTIALTLGKNKDDKNHYLFYAFDENAYYGFYRDSSNMMNIDNHYVYSFNEKAENKGDLSGLTATYKGKFIYSTRSIPELAMPADLKLTYENGEAKGEITSHLYGDKLFDVKTTDNARSLELNPIRELDNSWEEIIVRPDSPDRVAIDVHFINGKDGTENKGLVGKGGNDKYWGVIGAEKQ